jgi:hypothetical protein
MPKRNGVEISGLEAAMKMMDGLPLQMKGQALRSVHRKAMSEFYVKPAKAIKPEYKKIWKVTNTRDDKTGVIGAPYRKDVRPDKWGIQILWEEFGTAQRKTDAGQNRGIFEQDKPFVRALYQRQYKKMIKYLNNKYGGLIIKYLKDSKGRLEKRAYALKI